MIPQSLGLKIEKCRDIKISLLLFPVNVNIYMLAFFCGIMY